METALYNMCMITDVEGGWTDFQSRRIRSRG